MAQTKDPFSLRAPRYQRYAPAVLLLILPLAVAVPTCQPKAVTHVRR